MVGNIVYVMEKKCEVLSILEVGLQSLVKHSPCAGEYPDDDDTLIGHEYEEDGRYRTSYFPADPVILAGYLASSDKIKLITNSFDYALLCSSGKEIKVSVIANKYMDALYAELGKYSYRYCDFDKLLEKFLLEDEE